MTSGCFVTLDGPGGVGKSTTLNAVCESLRRAGTPVRATTEPSTSALGQFTRAHADQIKGHALACLVAADRYEHIRDEIRPQLDRGNTVVCDRYLASTLVVQQLDGVPEQFLLDLNADILLPDLAVILTADASAIRQRLSQRGAHHRFERDPDVPAREAALYRRAERTVLGLGVPVLVIDTTNTTPSATAERIASELRALTGNVASGPTDPAAAP
ncbi:dTMP kinase [Streptomyces sp. PTM05]|uniref:Thymidylate kinase n=1 Tax=Streptantibioticus parmotrematis TaxID=2873249 RepID=A0ABS7QTT9_9ACTN|nr:dTMP kinase [Streptantibioticus parmotrematis]MBY8886611.1 dTMP kinase [Streptantibioticus parmotrematis]